MIVDLPAPVAPTMPDTFAGSHVERDVAQDEIVVPVGERDVLEGDVPARARPAAPLARAGADVRPACPAA